MTMELLDSHAHLDFDSFATDREAVLERAWKTGLTQIICIGLGADGAREALALAEMDERIWATVGLHPHDAHLGVACEGDPCDPLPEEARAAWEKARAASLSDLEALVRRPKVVAIGEVGLDYHYDHSPRQLQRDLFRSFIRLAARSGLPLVIHTREASRDTIRILREERAERVGGVIHCFGGDPELERAALEMGFYLGLAGPLTFKKADELRAAARDVPLDRLLVETDCPYLAPVPYRGKRNEPAHVIEVVRKLAELRDLSPEEIGRITAANARRLFGM